MRHAYYCLNLFCLAAPLLVMVGCATGGTDQRLSLWIDVYTGEPTPYEAIMDDLAESRVIYVGERHTVDRHHALQERIVADLAARNVPLVLGIEQMEAPYQPTLDRYNAGEITFDELAKEVDWSERWNNYEDYRAIVEAAHDAGAPVLALNALAENVKQVARKRVAGLDAETRAELPNGINLDDPVYEAHLMRVLAVHAMMPAKMLRGVFEAQVTRDETMADRLCAFLQSEEGADRVAIVVCGAGHMSHGLGMPDRVARRMPGVRQRLIVMSESGDVVLSKRQKAMARNIEITHEQMRSIGRPIADYLYVTSPRQDASE